MRRELPVIVFFLVLVIASSGALGQGPVLVSEMEARKIIVNAENREIGIPADEVYPNDTIEYMLTYRNNGSAAASEVSLIGPIPVGTAYLDRSAMENEQLRPYFSIDGGKTYHKAPVTYVVVDKNGNEKRVKAKPDMITHIKWSMNGILDVAEEVLVTYRVRVR